MRSGARRLQMPAGSREERINAGRQRFEVMRAARRARASPAQAESIEQEPPPENDASLLLCDEEMNLELQSESPPAEATEAISLRPELAAGLTDAADIDPPQPRTSREVGEDEPLQDQELRRLEAKLQALQDAESVTMTELQVLALAQRRPHRHVRRTAAFAMHR